MTDLTPAAQALDDLRRAVERLPHNGSCVWQSGDSDCDCHKADALAAIERLAEARATAEAELRALRRVRDAARAWVDSTEDWLTARPKWNALVEALAAPPTEPPLIIPERTPWERLDD